MKHSNNILQELNELGSTLTNIDTQNVYIVPDGYFENLSSKVLNRIKALEAKNTAEELDYLSPVLNSISRQMPYAVPAGYFEELEERLMQSVRERSDYQTVKEEIESLSPILSGLNKKMPYSIPQDYFENLKAVSINTNTQSKAKVVSMVSRKRFHYAAAAIIVGVIALTGFLFINNKINNDPAKSFAKFEKKLDKEIKKTSDKELKEFVQQFTDAGLTGEEKVQTNPKEEAKDLLKDVPDTELKKFLEETADPDVLDDETMPVD
jgi:hypothetical protein